MRGQCGAPRLGVKRWSAVLKRYSPLVSYDSHIFDFGAFTFYHCYHRCSVIFWYPSYFFGIYRDTARFYHLCLYWSFSVLVSYDSHIFDFGTFTFYHFHHRFPVIFWYLSYFFGIYRDLARFHHLCLYWSCGRRPWQWPYRGICVGEARHLGPPRMIESEEERIFGSDSDTDTVCIDDLVLMADPRGNPDAVTEAPSDVGVAPLGVVIPLDVEMVSLVEAVLVLDVPSVAYVDGNGKHSDAFITALLTRLRQLPEIASAPTYVFIPKSLTKRYWAVVVGKVSSGAVNERGKAATLFLKAFDYLLTRDCRNLKCDALQELPKNDGVAIAQQIRSRIQQMVVGIWLVVEAIEDAKQVLHKSVAKRVVAASVNCDLINMRNMETCVFKVMHGDIRTGQRVLQSPGLHPPCQGTVDLIRTKFITSDDGAGSIMGHDLRKRALACT